MAYTDLIIVFTSIIYEALPFVVVGVVLAGILEEFVPQEWIARLFYHQDAPSEPQHPTFPAKVIRAFQIVFQTRVLAIALGALLGLIFPMCECGIIAVMRRLLRKGVPLSVCVSYMLSGPIINVVVITSTFVAFNPPSAEDYLFGGPLNVVSLRVGLAFCIAIITSVIVDWQYNTYGDQLLKPGLTTDQAKQDMSAQQSTFFQRISNITETALHDFVDIMAFLILGACLATVGRIVLAETELSDIIQQRPEVAILLMMGIAVLFCLCSEADAFVAANFDAAWPPAAKLSFLVLGPMLDLKLYLMYTQIFRPRLIWTIILSVVIQVFIFTNVVHRSWSADGYGYSPNQQHQKKQVP